MVGLCLGIRIVLPGKALVPARNRDRERYLHPNAGVPQLTELRPMEEDAIHEKDAILWQVETGMCTLDTGIGNNIPNGCDNRQPLLERSRD